MKRIIFLFCLISLSAYATEGAQTLTSVDCIKSQLDQSKTLEEAYQACSVNK